LLHCHLLRFLISGVTLGLASGLSPGPLLAFLVSQTVRHGRREGIKVALAPLLTDVPIITVSLLALSELPDPDQTLSAISLLGGLYVAWLGLGSVRRRPAFSPVAETSPHTLRKAMAINFLNPHAYLFWSAVGGPMILRAAGMEFGFAAAFVAGFYALLCGSKTVVALLVHRSRGFLAGRLYLAIVRALGAVLVGFGAWLAWEGLRYFIR